MFGDGRPVNARPRRRLGARRATDTTPGIPQVVAGSREGASEIGWGTASALAVLLGIIFPLAFAQPTFSSLGRLSVVLAWLLTLYSAARLWHLVLHGRDKMISLTFWLFIYVWLGLAALAETVSQQFPLFQQTFNQSTQVSALTAIIVGLAGYELGWLCTRSRRTRERSSYLLNAPTVQMRRVTIVGGIGILVVAYFTVKYGLGTRFSSRQAAAEAFFGTGGGTQPLWLQQNKTSALLQISVDWVLVFLTLYLVVYDQRIKRRRAAATGSRIGLVPRRRVLFAGLLVAVLLADNPLSNPRYRFAGIVLALLIAVWPLSTTRRFRIVAAALLAGALFVYPYAAVFRYNHRILQLTPLNTEFRTSADFAMFQQELNAQVYVKNNGFTWGRQLEGVALAWVPRRYWANKPTFTGGLILKDYISVIPASVSIFGWSFVDGGFVWVFLVLVVYGWATGALEQAYLRRPRDRLSFAAAAGPLFAAFQVFLVRGDLQPAVGELAPLALVLIAVCALPRRSKIGSVPQLRSSIGSGGVRRARVLPPVSVGETSFAAQSQTSGSIGPVERPLPIPRVTRWLHDRHEPDTGQRARDGNRTTGRRARGLATQLRSLGRVGRKLWRRSDPGDSELWRTGSPEVGLASRASEPPPHTSSRAVGPASRASEPPSTQDESVETRPSPTGTEDVQAGPLESEAASIHDIGEQRVRAVLAYCREFYDGEVADEVASKALAAFAQQHTHRPATRTDDEPSQDSTSSPPVTGSDQ
jgi:hypothetical protein